MEHQDRLAQNDSHTSTNTVIPVCTHGHPVQPTDGPTAILKLRTHVHTELNVHVRTVAW